MLPDRLMSNKKILAKSTVSITSSDCLQHCNSGIEIRGGTPARAWGDVAHNPCVCPSPPGAPPGCHVAPEGAQKQRPGDELGLMESSKTAIPSNASHAGAARTSCCHQKN